MILKRVRILAADVHDGLGGVHLRGQTPTLPGDIADLFVAKNLAVYEDDTRTQAEIKADAERLQDSIRQSEQKGRAESVMRFHDMLPEEVRVARHDAADPDKIVPITNPKKRGKGQR